MNATRAFTTTYGKTFRVGRVQTPTLAMLVERQEKIEHFVKETYYKVRLMAGDMIFVSESIKDRTEAEQLAALCSGKSAEVMEVNREKKRGLPPKLYDLTTLQREANRLFGYTAKETLDTLQELYEEKLLTYPRTDCRYVTSDMEETLLELAGDMMEEFLDFSFYADVRRVVNPAKVTDHHAILPTKQAMKAEWTGLSEKKRSLLYLTSMQVLKAVAGDFQYEQAEITVTCAGHEFHAKGKRTEQMDFSYLIQKRDHGFSGNPYDAETDRKYSLDTLPQEYSCQGNGDYRESTFAVRNQYGVSASDLRFQGYEILKGKYEIPGLPAFYAEDSAQADTLVISMKDRDGEILVKLYYGVFEEFDLITRAVCVENLGEEEVYLERALSCCVDQTCGNWDWMTFYGKHEMERQVSRTQVHHGIQSVGSLRGTSSHQYNPFVVLAAPHTTETQGNCFGVSLLYSGSFLAQVEKDQFDQTRVLMGIHPGNFCYKLLPGQSFWTPEALWCTVTAVLRQ